MGVASLSQASSHAYIVFVRCLVFVRHSDLTEQALALCEAPQLMVDVTGRGPNAALQHLRQTLPSDASSRLEWCRRAKIAAIVGSCPKSRDSFRSGPPFCMHHTSSWSRLAFVGYKKLDQLC